MSLFYVPYADGKPAAICINGHRLVILSRDKTAFQQRMGALGADALKPLRIGNSPEEESAVLNRLARSSNAGVVVAPDDIELPDVIRNLEHQLPWLQ